MLLLYTTTLLINSAFLEATRFFRPAGSTVAGIKHMWRGEGKEGI